MEKISKKRDNKSLQKAKEQKGQDHPKKQDKKSLNPKIKKKDKKFQKSAEKQQKVSYHF